LGSRRSRNHTRRRIAIRERESARKSAAARVEELDSLEREAREFDASAKADELRAVLKDWTAMLEKYPETGRQVLRQIIRGPLRVKHEADGGWTIAGVGSFGGIVRRVYGFQVPEDEMEQLNAYAELLNAEAEALARPPLFDAGLPVDGGTPEKSGISAVQQETCPRQGSQHRHDLLRALPPLDLHGVVRCRRRRAIRPQRTTGPCSVSTGRCAVAYD
jgi:hypothetical protein